jgi:hypothetical protein
VTARIALTSVVIASYRTGVSGMSKPSIAVKCMSQMPPPSANAAVTNQRTRRLRFVAARARAVQARARAEPR